MLISLQNIVDKSLHHREGWTHLLDAIGNPADMSTIVSIGDIAKACGASFALWCTECIDDRRSVVSLIMPAIERATIHAEASDKCVHDRMTAIKEWLAGDDSIDPYTIGKVADKARRISWHSNDELRWPRTRAYILIAVEYAAEAIAVNAAVVAEDIRKALARSIDEGEPGIDIETYTTASAAAKRVVNAAEAAARAADDVFYKLDDSLILFEHRSAYAAEIQRQIADIIDVSPLYSLKAG